MGRFGAKSGSKMGQKHSFPKVSMDHLGCRKKKEKRAHFGPIVSHFGPSKVPKSLDNGPLCGQKWVKNGSKMCFSKKDPGPFGVLKWDNSAHFEPILRTCWSHLSLVLMNGSATKIPFSQQSSEPRDSRSWCTAVRLGASHLEEFLALTAHFKPPLKRQPNSFNCWMLSVCCDRVCAV